MFHWIYNDMTQNFCQFPWTSLLVNIDEDRWRWCTKVPNRLGFSKFYPISKDLDSVKEGMLDNTKPKQCTACWREENVGFKSHRIVENGSIVEGYNLGIRFLDVALSKHCPMACATCGPESSTRWRDIHDTYDDIPYANRFSPTPKVNKEQSFQKILGLVQDNISSLERINLIGGETAQDPLFYSLAERLLSLDVLRNKTLIRIVTSANYTDDKFLDTLQQLKSKGFRLRIVVSIDAAYAQQEFLRAGVVWDRFEKNTLELISAGFCKDINVVVSSINIGMISSIPNWLELHNLLDTVNPNLIFVQDKFSLATLGGMGLYLLPTWKAEHREHVIWKELIQQINRTIRRNRFVLPNEDALLRLARYIQWYATTNKFTMPDELKKFFYLVELYKRQPLLFGQKVQQGTDQTDPE